MMRSIGEIAEPILRDLGVNVTPHPVCFREIDRDREWRRSVQVLKREIDNLVEEFGAAETVALLDHLVQQVQETDR